MLEYMDEIVESVKEFTRGATEWAAAVVVMCGKVLLIITAPVWILPYTILRRDH